jgi:hypothetical protein
VDERMGPNLLSSQLELLRGETVLATDPADIEFGLHFLPLSDDDRQWLLGHLRAAVKAVHR